MQGYLQNPHIKSKAIASRSKNLVVPVGIACWPVKSTSWHTSQLISTSVKPYQPVVGRTSVSQHCWWNLKCSNSPEHSCETRVPANQYHTISAISFLRGDIKILPIGQPCTSTRIRVVLSWRAWSFLSGYWLKKMSNSPYCRVTKSERKCTWINMHIDRHGVYKHKPSDQFNFSLSTPRIWSDEDKAPITSTRTWPPGTELALLIKLLTVTLRLMFPIQGPMASWKSKIQILFTPTTTEYLLHEAVTPDKNTSIRECAGFPGDPRISTKQMCWADTWCAYVCTRMQNTSRVSHSMLQPAE